MTSELAFCHRKTTKDSVILFQIQDYYTNTYLFPQQKKAVTRRQRRILTGYPGTYSLVHVIFPQPQSAQRRYSRLCLLRLRRRPMRFPPPAVIGCRPTAPHTPSPCHCRPGRQWSDQRSPQSIPGTSAPGSSAG